MFGSLFYNWFYISRINNSLLKYVDFRIKVVLFSCCCRGMLGAHSEWTGLTKRVECSHFSDLFNSISWGKEALLCTGHTVRHSIGIWARVWPNGMLQRRHDNRSEGWKMETTELCSWSQSNQNTSKQLVFCDSESINQFWITSYFSLFLFTVSQKRFKPAYVLPIWLNPCFELLCFHILIPMKATDCNIKAKNNKG